MKLPAIFLTVLVVSAALWAQALTGYVGATAPAAGFAAKPPLAIRMPHKQLSSQAPAARPGAHCKPVQAAAAARCPRRRKDGSFARQITLAKQGPGTQPGNVTAKKISDPGAITIQR